MNSLTRTISALPRMYWFSNILELFERWAWYGIYNGLALYLTLSKDTGALGFSQAEMGIIMGTGSMLLYFLPVITGAVADRVGYKKVLILSFFMYITGYLMIASFDGFYAVFFAFIYTAIGGAFFKPVISGTISKLTNEKNSSVGFGIFYMMVNIGAFLGPFIAGIIYKTGWNYVFAVSIAAVTVNFALVLLFYKDPVEKKTQENIKQTIILAFRNIGSALSDYKYLIFLVIMTGFWTAYNQLFYSFPVFLEQWADTSGVYSDLHTLFPKFAELIGTAENTISPVTITGIDAFFIILFQIAVSTFVMRFKPLNTIIGGSIILAIGLAVMFSTQNGWFIISGIFIFGIGEMTSSPKFTEYVGRMAPVDKTALYMGTSYLPFAAAHQLSGILSGSVYGTMADKFVLARNEVSHRGISLPEIGDSFTKNDLFESAARNCGMTGSEFTQFLWNNAHPERIWVIFSGIALASAVLLFFYDKFLLGRKEK